jgi:signal transduction histidine kinase
VRDIVSYAASVLAGATLAILAASFGAPDNVYVMFAVLLVVSTALASGTGPALAAAVTAVFGDDLLLRGRLPPLEQWKDLSVFAIVAIIVGWLVARARAQQLEAEGLADREHQLRAERDAILASISHDVKNPLAVIIGSARRGIADGETKGDVARLFRRIDSAAQQAAHLIDALSDLHALDGNQVELDLRCGDLRRTTEAAIDQMEALAQNHTFRYSAPGSPVITEYDERRIQRLLQNRIENAIKYSPDGGPIEIEVRASSTEARILVRDHGIGIPAAARPYVFERGFRARTVGAIPGTGLGLFISAEIVKRHHGTIGCFAPPDGGTLVTLQLPLARVGQGTEGVQQLPGHRTGLAGANRAVVDRDDRDGLARRARQERFVGAE